MAYKLPLLCDLVILLSVGLTCNATQYVVGDIAGWDLSADLDTWAQDKTFYVGDVLLFQYSYYHSVVEVNKEDFSGCNVTNMLQTSSNGNTSFVLTSPGERFFVCGNKLYCLGGMKLQINVLENQAASAVAKAPQASALEPGATSTLSHPSSKIDNSLPTFPTSAGSSLHGEKGALIIAFLSYMGTHFCH
ncbi:PREDICTED: stellacyanin-like [Nelumbo nucifera]|uniref:Phytocyanin domain-containing protein n=2 Tax=Nelumbo nucifera TaxID=4432 RepID=A0A822XFB8_NELNU|nr:PREDICTED: stellacyanin-like [Nelumbo nucifera]DAD18363.1 TPA_asm: hypothetical protein HUJ06_019826 [Nelumbo nucifera]